MGITKKILKFSIALIFGLVLYLSASSNTFAQQVFEVDRIDDAEVWGCTSAANDCTLRGAVRRANESVESYTQINFRIPLNVIREITLTNGVLSINKKGQLTIVADDVTINANNQSTVFTIGNMSSVAINGLTITGGRTQTLPERGGAIYNKGNLTFYYSIIENNSSNQNGGGIYNEGTMTIMNSTIRNNSALASGGGIYNINGTINVFNSTINDNSSGSIGGFGGGIANSNGTFTVTNSTIYGNEGNNGGGIGNNGIFTIKDSTVSNNGADSVFGVGGGVGNFGSGTFNSRNSIIAGNFAPNGTDFSGTLNSLGYNLIQTPILTTIIGNTTGNILGQNPLLDPNGLQNNGGETQTLALLPNSPAIDAADPDNFESIDQRGKSRPADGDNNGAALPDIGAFELTRTLIVTRIANTTDGTCDEDCSLTEAIADANSTNTDEIIVFDPAVFDIGEPVTLDFVSETILNRGSLSINGTGMEKLILVKGFNTNAQLTVSNLTITGGSTNRGVYTLNNVTIRNSTSFSSGGAIYNYATVNLNDSVVRDNNAVDSGGGIFNSGFVNINNTKITNNFALREGGGIRGGRIDIRNSVISNNTSADGGGIFAVNYGGIVIIENSTVDGNRSNFGGGIVSYGNLNIIGSTISNNISTDGAGGVFYRFGTFNLINSTVSGNTAVGDGGGISNLATINLISSTVAQNSSISGGGIISVSGMVNARNSIIADNSSEDFYGTINSQGYNLIENTQNTNIIGSDLETNIIGVDPQLLPLSNYGGLTKTHALKRTSPAIDKGLATEFLTTSFDQRRELRPIDILIVTNAPNGDSSDIGAFERQENDRNGQTLFDFDGDSRTDISVFRSGDGEWWYLRSSDNSNRAFQFGSSTDKIVPADFTGDGKTDIAIFKPSSGDWFILRSEDSSFYSFPFGTAGDIPVAADFDGDGKADPTIFRPSNSTWYTLNSTGGTSIRQFGINGDLPVVGDYDGDGKADLAIFRPSNGQWWINRSASQTTVVYSFGTSTDKLVPADYTGDGKTDVAFFRPSSGEWFILRSEDASFYSFPFGTSGDIPAAGDYDGDGRADAAVFRNSNTTWYLQQSTNGFSAVGFGLSGDKPVPSAYIP